MDQAVHWQELERENKRKGMVVSAIIHALLLLFFLFYVLPLPKLEDQIQGVLIDFGTSRTGLGENAEPAAAQQETEQETQLPAAPAASQTPAEIADEMLTQDVEVAPAVKPQTQPAKPTPQEIAAQQAAAEQAAAEAAAAQAAQEAQDLKDQLDQAWGSGQGGEGTSSPNGDQGVSDGVQNGPHNDGLSSTGLGDSGIGHDLSGRRMVKKPDIKDSSQKTGKVAVRVRVDRNGNVIHAQYTTKGSTTTDSYLIRLAEQAARQAKFNSDVNASAEQIGTITFTFRVQ